MIPQAEAPAAQPIRDSWKALLAWGKEELSALGPRESQIDAEYLFEEASDQKKWQLYLEDGSRPAPEAVETYRRWIGARKRRIPTAYVTGRAYFREEILEVGPGCLVPRPETERLVDAVLETAGFERGQAFSFLDLGTGSGAIALALLRHFKNARALLSDISPEALAIAGRNVETAGVRQRAGLMQSDLFESLSGLKWDLIVSNPPYLAAQDWADIEPELVHEPRIALDGGVDGLKVYRRTLERAAEFLRPGGWIFFESGRGQAPAVANLLAEKQFVNIKIWNDYAGIERVIAGQRAHG